MMMTNTGWLLEWYPKLDSKISRLIDDEELKFITLEELSNSFDLDDDDPYMIGLYQVEQKNLCILQKYVKHKIDLEKYDYFVGAYAKTN